jgi:hypothetical protein
VSIGNCLLNWPHEKFLDLLVEVFHYLGDGCRENWSILRCATISLILRVETPGKGTVTPSPYYSTNKEGVTGRRYLMMEID